MYVMSVRNDENKVICTGVADTEEDAAAVYERMKKENGREVKIESTANWIDTKKEQPPKDLKVLGILNTGFVGICWRWSQNSWIMEGTDFEGNPNHCSIVPTHWMFIPRPPSGYDKEEVAKRLLSSYSQRFAFNKDTFSDVAEPSEFNKLWNL